MVCFSTVLNDNYLGCTIGELLVLVLYFVSVPLHSLCCLEQHCNGHVAAGIVAALLQFLFCGCVIVLDTALSCFSCGAVAVI